MSDIYVPGVKSRFNTEKIVEDLMRVERLPRERTEKSIEGLRTEKTYWQDLGRRVNALRDSARQLYSFQNPFNDRVVVSQDEGVITGTASREASEQERSFTVKQTAQADRFLSRPLEDSFRVEQGTYTFTVGEDRVSFSFRGGALREFAEALNQRGKDKIHAAVWAVEKGMKSLLIESLIPGEANRLGFADAAEKLAAETGIAERADDAIRDIPLAGVPVDVAGDVEGAVSPTPAAAGTVEAWPESKAAIPLNPPMRLSSSSMLSFEALTAIITAEETSPEPLPELALPGAGSVSYGDVTIENDPFLAPSAAGRSAESKNVVDDLGILSLTLSDGGVVRVPPIRDSDRFSPYQIPVGELAEGKNVVSITIENPNANRNISVRNLRIFDPSVTPGGFRPLNPVSVAQDALVTMDGIEIKRPTNTIDDLIPGVTVTVQGVSDRPVKIGIEPDRESVKEAIIELVGNYNRLAAEINVVTRNDERVIQELTYLSREEQTELRERLGKFMGDSSLSQFKSGMQQAAGFPYPTQTDQDTALLAQIGIGTDVRRGGATSGYDPSRLRGYLEIDEKALDAAIAAKLTTVQRLFGFDTDGDLIIDSGFAYSMDRLARPYVETGGLIAAKTNALDSKISQEQRRLDTLDRQLAAKEADLKRQYSQMEGAYNRMERMSTSIDQFSEQASNSRR